MIDRGFEGKYLVFLRLGGIVQMSRKGTKYPKNRGSLKIFHEPRVSGEDCSHHSMYAAISKRSPASTLNCSLFRNDGHQTPRQEPTSYLPGGCRDHLERVEITASDSTTQKSTKPQTDSNEQSST